MLAVAEFLTRLLLPWRKEREQPLSSAVGEGWIEGGWAAIGGEVSAATPPNLPIGRFPRCEVSHPPTHSSLDQACLRYNFQVSICSQVVQNVGYTIRFSYATDIFCFWSFKSRSKWPLIAVANKADDLWDIFQSLEMFCLKFRAWEGFCGAQWGEGECIVGEMRTHCAADSSHCLSIKSPPPSRNRIKTRPGFVSSSLKALLRRIWYSGPHITSATENGFISFWSNIAMHCLKYMN